MEINCVDYQVRNIFQTIGVALPNSEESLKTIIIDMIRTETAKREMKRRKIEAVHPEQILVRHARERISSILFDFKPLLQKNKIK